MAAGLGYVCSCVMQTLKKDMALFFFNFLFKVAPTLKTLPSQKVAVSMRLQFSHTVFTTAAQQQCKTLQILILIVFVTWLNLN